LRPEAVSSPLDPFDLAGRDTMPRRCSTCLPPIVAGCLCFAQFLPAFTVDRKERLKISETFQAN
jgi:hypothetical protein